MSESWKSVRNSFFAGLVVVVPVVASVAILVGFFNWVTDFLLPRSLRACDDQHRRESYSDAAAFEI